MGHKNVIKTEVLLLKEIVTVVVAVVVGLPAALPEAVLLRSPVGVLLTKACLRLLGLG